jgi:hypothetical protein
MDTIELLNGELFRHDEILELMKDDKFYYEREKRCRKIS